MNDIAKAHRYTSADRTGCLAFDSMKMAEGVYFHHQTGQLLGLAGEDMNPSVLISEFRRRAAGAEEESKEPARASEHLVAYWTSINQGKNLSFLVGSWNLSTITSAWLTEHVPHLLREL
jgi:hypothetical protein